MADGKLMNKVSRKARNAVAAHLGGYWPDSAPGEPCAYYLAF
jgi:hypothetical protein